MSRKYVAAPILALGLAVLGCMSATPSRPQQPDGSTPATADAAHPAPASTGGSGGSTTPASTGGTGGMAAAGGSGGTTPTGTDASVATAADAKASADSGGGVVPTGGPVDWVNCGQSTFKPGISAADFCMKYMSACNFDPSGGGAGTERYKSLADCVASYMTLSDGPMGGKACVAWQVCIAGHPMNADTFCPRAPEASMMAGPCKPAYL